MATRTTTQDGNWSDTATWTGGLKPGDGDEADVNHNVTVDEAIIIGARTAATTYAAMTIATGKTVTFSPSLSHTIKGGIHHEGTAQVVVSSTTGTGVIIEFDCADRYEWRTSDGHNNAGKIVLNGGASSRIKIRSKSGGSYAWINDGTGPWLQAGLVEAEYTDFLRMGDSSTPAIRTSPTSNTTFKLYRCSLDTCGDVNGTYNIGADCTYRIVETSFKNTTHASRCLRLNNTNTKTGGTRELLDCVFDLFAELYQPRDFTIKRNLFNRSFGTTNGDWTAFENNVVRITSGSESVIAAGSTLGNFWFFDNPTEYNPHFIECLNYERDLTIDGDIFDCSCDVSSPAQEGDCILLDDTMSVPTTVTIQNVIIVKGPSNRTVGTLVTALGNANAFVEAYHCTVHTGSQGFAVGETYTGHANMVGALKSCIFWDENGSQGYKMYDVATNDNVPDLGAAADLDYNCGYNLLAGSNGKGYNNLEFSSGSPGANDITQNPDFVNKSANFKTWDAQNGGPGTVANAFTELRKRNDSDFNVNYTAQNLIGYIRAAFMPQNLALQGAAHDSGDIGAVTITGGGSGGAAGKRRSTMGIG